MRLARIGIFAVAVLVATTAAASAHDPFTEPGTMYVEFLVPPQPPEEVDAFFNDNFGLFANGERCFSFTFNDVGWSDYGDHVGQTVVLGRESQPLACRQEGAHITFGDGADRWLAMITTFQPNMQSTINDYTLDAPALGGPIDTVEAPIEPLTPMGPEGPPPPRPLRPVDPADADDLQWAFLPRGPLADERVRAAFALSLDPTEIASQAGLPPSSRLLYAAENVRALPAEDVDLLLAAAGVRNPDDGTLSLRLARVCRVAVPMFDATSVAWRSLVAQARDTLAKAVPAALARLGLQVGECDLTDDLKEADIVVWGPGQQVDLMTAPPTEDSFLAYVFPDAGPTTGGQGGPIALPNTGSGGLANEAGRGAWLPWAAGAAVAILAGAGLAQVRRLR